MSNSDGQTDKSVHISGGNGTEGLERPATGGSKEVPTEEAPTVYEAPATSTALQEHQKHTIGRALACGLPVHEIASMIQHTPRYVKKCIAEDAGITSLVAYYSGQIVKAEVSHRFKMIEKLDKCHAVIDEGLDATDIKVRLDTVWKVIDRVIPKQAGQLDVNIGVKGVDPEDHKVVALSLIHI